MRASAIGERRPRLKSILVGVAGICCMASPAWAQRIDYSKLEVQTSDLGHGVYLLSWTGGDSVLLTGPDGALLVDTSVPQMIGKITAAVARVSDKPVRYVINAHAHADHFGGNEVMARDGAVIIAQENVRKRMASGQYIAAFNQVIPPSAPDALPVITYGDAMSIHLDGETVDLIHPLSAHTDSDSVIYFRTANVVHIGGSYGAGTSYPFYDISSGGSLNGVIALQERVLRMIDDNTRIIADEGAPEGKSGLQAEHDMLVKLRDRVQQLIREGRSEAEVIAAKPSADLDPTWVPKGGFLTGDVAVRMAYQSLKGVKPPTSPPTASGAPGAAAPARPAN
jgi:glyoxylase-like metal-dependent hydrolase (beta-lactamase superfamily II)